VENIKNKPYPWIHEYDIQLTSNHGRATIGYVLHSDYRSAKDKRAIAELKHRLSFCYNGCKVKHIHPKPKKTRVNRYLYQIKKGVKNGQSKSNSKLILV
jgi:hypothetical protein